MDTRFRKIKPDEDVPEFQSGEKWRIWKNILVLGVAFMIHFTAFFGASNLQSSVNADGALGTSTLAAIYGALLVSNIFLPAMVIRWFGCKWTVALSFLTYTPFIMAQFYPKFYTMIPAGLLVGFGGGPLWCAKCTYLTVISETYEKVSDVSANTIVIKFYGVFFMLFQLSQVWGNLISAEILSSGHADGDVKSLLGSFQNETETNLANFTEMIFRNASQDGNKVDLGDICGANFCPGSTEAANPNLTPPPESKIHLIAGIYLACMVLAVLIVAVGVDSLSRYNKGRKTNTSEVSGLKMLAVTLKHLSNPLQILILPITMYIGAEQAFITADFNAEFVVGTYTNFFFAGFSMISGIEVIFHWNYLVQQRYSEQAFVSCGWGISNIGFVMICYGVSNAISSMLIGSITKLTGRNPVIGFALILHIALMIVLLNWRPNGDNKYMYFLVVGLWGAVDAIWLVQINSLSGILFPGQEEAAYSNFRLWESTGSVLTYVYSPYLCTHIKVYLLMALLVIGVCGYAAVQVIEARNKNKEIEEHGKKGKFVLVGQQVKSREVAD